MRTFKRNAVIVIVVLFVCVAAYLNWSYGEQAEESAAGITNPGESPAAALDPDGETVGAGAPDDGAEPGADVGLFYDTASASRTGGFFAEARINRSQARDAAVETLAAVNAADGASREVLDAALVKITAIADYSRTEAELEALIMAHGFNDCVVFISDDGVKVTVPSPQAGLSTVDVAKITDAVTSETQFKAAQLKIIEVK
ncbi:MAG: SpoIIIAH-like family protein [Oscillospiraceae bacterium]|jgi:stage III sporulation protein AH|nr:SpoIIIAH-like family protein [Oscillospiraceae bacterium]